MLEYLNLKSEPNVTEDPDLEGIGPSNAGRSEP